MIKVGQIYSKKPHNRFDLGSLAEIIEVTRIEDAITNNFFKIKMREIRTIGMPQRTMYNNSFLLCYELDVWKSFKNMVRLERGKYAPTSK